jgi:hypothetical protein
MGSGKQNLGEVCLPRMLDKELRNRRLRPETLGHARNRQVKMELFRGLRRRWKG